MLFRSARKAFYPARIPFPLLHIDTGWKFKELIEFRNNITNHYDVEVIVHSNSKTNPVETSPFTLDAQEYTRIAKTVALKEALDLYKFDAAIGGARRDEERSRAKERIFSVREPGHVWTPHSQRPELWHHFNTQLAPGQTMRVFPLSNWTERDVWHYTRIQNIPFVPLYLAKPRPTITVNNSIIMVDDERIPIPPDQTPVNSSIRFLSLRCYPLSAAIESSAETIDQIIEELEPVRRGVYGGCVGYIDFAGDMDTAIAIRTAVIKAYPESWK